MLAHLYGCSVDIDGNDGYLDAMLQEGLICILKKRGYDECRVTDFAIC